MSQRLFLISIGSPITPKLACSGCGLAALMTGVHDVLLETSTLVVRCHCTVAAIPFTPDEIAVLFERAARREVEQRTADLWLFADGLYLCDHDVAPRLFVARSSSTAF